LQPHKFDGIFYSVRQKKRPGSVWRRYRALCLSCPTTALKFSDPGGVLLDYQPT